MDPTESELLAAMQRGDSRALGVLLERALPALYRFGLKMCGDPEDARDVMQDTLLAAVRGAGGFRGDSSLTTWLFTLARSFCIKKRRRRVGAPKAFDPLDSESARDLASPGDAPDEALGHQELAAALEAAIDGLEPRYREVLVLRDVEGLTAPEVARVLGLGVDAVKSRLHRARAVVRGRVTPFLEDEAAVSGARCPDVVPLFSRYVEGDIGPDECARMQAHVDACPRCRTACDSLKKTLLLCRTASREGAVPAEVQALVRAALRQATVRGGTL